MAKENSKGTVVRRIKASGGNSSAARTDEAKVVKKSASKSPSKASKNPIRQTVTKKSASKSKKSSAERKQHFFLFRPIFAIGRYFRNSWRELRQVRWTNRRATWALTLAVILFCLFFAALIMLVDWIFNWTIQEVIL
jgi:preprotein translocase SecE subunit